MDDKSFDQLENELNALRECAADLDRRLAEGCRLLIDEFFHRYPPLKRVPELELRPETLQKWLEEHRDRQL